MRTCKFENPCSTLCPTYFFVFLRPYYAYSNDNCRMSKRSPARGAGRGLRIPCSPRPQTSVATVCPRIHHHHPAAQLPKPYLIVTHPSMPWSCGSCGRQSLIFQGLGNRGNSYKTSVLLLARRQQQQRQLQHAIYVLYVILEHYNVISRES